MSIISKCRECGNQVPKSNPIMTDETNHPFRFCSLNCTNLYFKQEAEMDLAGQEFSSLCAKAIKKGEEESGRTFEDAGDSLIMSWIDKYALKLQN
jgi:hypothetical protein